MHQGWSWIEEFVYYWFAHLGDLVHEVTANIQNPELSALITSVICSAALTVLILLTGFVLQVFASLFGIIFKREHPRRG